jgi:indole-3-glycerol phosphate synthase
MNAGARGEAAGMLDAIAASVRTALVQRRARVPSEAVESAAARRTPGGRAFRDAIGRKDRINIIAECKRRSPSRGVLAGAYDPAGIARAYARAGAVAVSVLTEPTFFDGALAHLEAVRDAVKLPLLRKDFVLDEYQIYEARAAGADAILLIAAMLDVATLGRLASAAGGLGLAAIVEVHARREMEAAAGIGAEIIGVNSRNLRTLTIDARVPEALVEHAPPGCLMVAESGIGSRADIDRLARAGYNAFLVGERLMSAPDPEAALAGLLGPGTGEP